MKLLLIQINFDKNLSFTLGSGGIASVDLLHLLFHNLEHFFLCLEATLKNQIKKFLEFWKVFENYFFLFFLSLEIVKNFFLIWKF